MRTTWGRVARNFLFCPRPPGCGYVSTGGGARCSQRLWAAEVGHRWWRQCPQQIGKLGRGNGAAPRAPRRMRCRSRQRAVQGSRPERRCAIDGRLALGVPSVHRRWSPKLVDGQCRQRGRRRRGLVRRFRAPEAWSAVPAFRGFCAATARDCTAALATGGFSTRTIFTTAAPARPRAMTAASNKAEPASRTRDLPLTVAIGTVRFPLSKAIECPKSVGRLSFICGKHRGNCKRLKQLELLSRQANIRRVTGAKRSTPIPKRRGPLQTRSQRGTPPSARRQRTAQSPSLRSLPIRDKERRLEKQSPTLPTRRIN